MTTSSARCSLSLALVAVLAACSGGGGGTTSATGGPGPGTSTTSGNASGTTSSGSGTTSGGASSGTTSSSGAATLSQFTSAYISDACSFAQRCHTLPAYELAECQTYGTASLTAETAELAAEITAGLAAYNPTAGQACLTAITSTPCGAEPACGTLVTPKVAVGGTCYGDEDCIDSSCSSSASAGACPGTCAAYVEDGGDCSVAECDPASGLTCDGVSSGTTTTYNCIPSVSSGFGDAGLGGGCGYDQTTATYVICDPNLYCPNGTNPTCQAAVGDGGVCPTGDECAVGLVCYGSDNGQVGSDAGTCYPAADTGGNCIPDGNLDDGLVTGCLSGLTCVESNGAGTCQIPPPVGSPCSTDPAAQCQLGDYCAVSSCQAQLANGAACTTGTDCLSGNCNGTANLCESVDGCNM